MKLYTELAEYYYEIEKSGRKFQEEVLFLDEIYKKHKVQSVLDIGCGTGEHVLGLYALWPYENPRRYAELGVGYYGAR